MAVETHPASETLAAFARGALPSAELSAVAEHVENCTSCLAAIERVPDDALGSLARAAGRPDAPAPTALQTLTSFPFAIPEALANHPRYKILGELGSGGMGVVYKAEDQIMGRTVALKVMTPHLTAKSNAVDRFRKEVRAAAQLNHANIVTAHDAGEAGGRHFLVMEFVEGISLDRLVAKKGPLAVPMAAQFARQAALGLQHASEKGMVHRDIKPQNLMVTRKGHVKVMDFGLARFASADAEETSPPTGRLPFGAGKPVVDSVTNPNLLLGTPDYLSPEQARNSHDVDACSDVYSLGCTLYFLLTGKPPFAKAESLIDKLLAHTEEDPPAVRDLRPEVPEGLAVVLNRMMAKRPSDRYATPGEAASALAPFTKAAASEAPAAPGFEVIDAVVIAPAPAAAFAFDTPAGPNGPTLIEPARPRKAKKAKRAAPWWRSKVFLAAGAVAALAVIGIIIAASGKKKVDPPSGGGETVQQPPVSPGPGHVTPKGKEKTNPWQAGGERSLKGVKVLFVLPSSGVWLRDFVPVRDALKAEGIEVVTASTDGGTSTPTPDPVFPGEPVKIDRILTVRIDTKEFAALLFCGYKSDEYTFLNRGSAAALAVMKQMQSDGKPIAGICTGQAPLIAHAFLRNRSAAPCPQLFEKMPFVTGPRSGIKWDSTRRVVVDDKVITAATDADGPEFAAALVKVLKAD